MKKKLALAAPLLAALAPCAMAQSSVTLFGVVDVALTRVHASEASKTLVSSGNDAISRIGFRGVEDLGGGMSAGFWLEAGIFADTGTGYTTNVNNQSTGTGPSPTGGQGLTFNRRSTVSLAGHFGEVRLGRDVAPHYWNIVAYDPFGHIGIAAPIVLGATVGGPTNTWVRTSNSIMYLTPNTLGGFYGHFDYFLGENLQNGAATQKDGGGWSGRLGYKAGPAEASVGAMRTTYASGNVSNYSVGGSWDFGVVKLMGVRLKDKIDGPSPSGSGWELGATAPVGAGLVKASYSTYKTTAPGEPTSKKFGLGYVYSLSKRTAVYIIGAHVSNENGAAQTLAGTPAGPNGRATGYDVGIRTSF